MHLFGADLRRLMPEVGEIEGHSIVLGLAEGERNAGAIVIASEKNVLGRRLRRVAEEDGSWPEAAQGSRSAYRRCGGSGGRRRRANSGKPGRMPPRSTQVPVRPLGPIGYPPLSLLATAVV